MAADALAVSAPWLADFEAELLQFTADGRHAHDDQVDVLAYAAREMALDSAGADERPVAVGGLREPPRRSHPQALGRSPIERPVGHERAGGCDNQLLCT